MTAEDQKDNAVGGAIPLISLDFIDRVSALLGTDAASLRSTLASGSVLSDLLTASGITHGQLQAALPERAL